MRTSSSPEQHCMIRMFMNESSEMLCLRVCVWRVGANAMYNEIYYALPEYSVILGTVYVRSDMCAAW